ncbi:MAG: peptide chain release factor N(5)-glutamine methyltransferase, partial [Planctomycetota bacterium]
LEPRTAREMLELARAFLAKKGVESSRREAELVVAHALGLDRLGLFLALDRPLARDEVVRGRELLTRRGKREPTAYLTGQREFYGRVFQVGPGVLVPRPETELLVDRARTLAGERADLGVLDLGTGSGCLAITLALELAGARVTASDLSARALAFARANAERLGATVEFLEGDGLAPVRARRFDLVVSNPPYVDPAERASLAPEVAEHEPSEALFAPAGKPDHWAELLARAARELLAPGGTLLIELGFDQAPRLRGALADLGLPLVFTRDLERVERVLEVGPV